MKSVSERVRVARILFVMGLSVVFAFAGAAVGAGAGTYGVIDLTPPEFHPDDYIRPTGIDGGRQAGYAFSYVATNSQFHAILWSGTATAQARPQAAWAMRYYGTARARAMWI
jgi:hypothetical protein